MDPQPTMQAPPSVTLPVTLVADLQDSLLMAMTDLQRLEGLLDHATGNLLERFGNANRDLSALEAACGGGPDPHPPGPAPGCDRAAVPRHGHAVAGPHRKMLKGCAWRLAEQAMAPDEDEDEQPLALDPMPDRPSPVTQNEMDAGSIELF